MANSKITDLSSLTAASGDEIPVNRAGSDGKITLPLPVAAGGTGQTTAAEALGEMTQALTADATPDQLADYIMTYDASADTGKKVLLKNAMRARITSTRTYYVRTTGSDANDGLTVGSPKLTIQSAVDDALANDDQTAFNLKTVINVGAGTFADQIVMQNFGAPRLWFEIHGATEATTTIGAIYASRQDVEVHDCTIAHGNTHLFHLDHFTFGYVGPNVTFSGGSAQDACFAVSDSHLNLEGVTFSGTLATAVYADLDSTVQQFGGLEADAAFSYACVRLDARSVWQNHAQDFTNSGATGKRFVIENGSSAALDDTTGLNFFPGNAKGSLDSWSSYKISTGTFLQYLGADGEGVATAAIVDYYLNEILIFDTATADTAVNEFTIAHATTGNAPSISATGDNTDIGFKIASKGTGTVQLAPGGTNEVLVSSTDTSPATNDGNALGTTALGWSDLHLATGGVINWANGEVTLTETDANTLTVAGATAVSLGTSAAFTAGTIELGHASANTLSASSGVLSVEGVAVAMTGKQTIWVPASAMTPAASNGAAATTRAINTITTGFLAFDQTTSESAYFNVTFPKSWNESTVTAQVYWTTTGGAAAETLEFEISGGCFANDAAINVTGIGTAVAHTDTWIADDDVHVTAEGSAITLSNAAVDTVAWFRIVRDVANDTLTADAELIGVKLFYTTDAGNDA
jgi:hypothetical protein